MGQKQHDLPANLGSHEVSGILYYRYRFPDGKRKQLGTNRDAAIRAALILNDKTAGMRQENRLAALAAQADHPMGERNPPFDVVADAYKEKRFSKLGLETAKQRSRDIEVMKKWFGSMPIRKIEPYDVTRRFEMLTSPHRLAKFRFLGIDIWRFAISHGKAAINVVEVTDTPAQVFTKSERARQRKRHTWQGFQRILDSSPEWLSFALLIALYSAQRRSDLVNMSWDKVDMAARTIEVKQKKTGVFLKIQMGDELYNVIKWFYKKQWGIESPTLTGRTRWEAQTPCPKVIHRKPQRRNQNLTAAVRRGDMHWYEVTGSTLTHEFKDARERSGYYAHLAPRERPSLHDIRALGLFCMFKAGYPIPYIQALAGHAGEAMTHYYLSGHEQIRPVEVEAGLSIKDLKMEEIVWDQAILPPALELIAGDD
jgi:integrase